MFILLFSLQVETVSHISYDIHIINNDIAGFEDDDDYFSYNYSISLEFIKALQDEQFREFFSITVVNASSYEAEIQSLNNEEFQGLLIIESSFSEKLLYEETGIHGNPKVDIITINDELAYNLITRITAQIINSISLQLYEGEFANLEIETDLNLEKFTFFDLFFPSIIIASILLCISQVATHFTAEKESGIILRLSTTAISRSQILISGVLAQFLITGFQIILMFSLGTILGVDIHPNANGILIILILSLMTFSALGLGLLLASFLKTYNQAGIFSWFIILPFLFLGGIFTYGAEFEYSFLFPTYWATHALQMVMLYGINSWKAIGFDIIYLIIFSLIITTIGILLFQRKKAIFTSI